MVNDDMFWDLLAEQHQHDVVMIPSRKEMFLDPNSQKEGEGIMKFIKRHTGEELWITDCDPWKKSVLMFKKKGEPNTIHHAATFRNEFMAEQFTEFLKGFINADE